MPKFVFLSLYVQNLADPYAVRLTKVLCSPGSPVVLGQRLNEPLAKQPAFLSSRLFLVVAHQCDCILIFLSCFLSSLAGSTHCLLFFFFLPTACAGYPVWSIIPRGDHRKLPGKFIILLSMSVVLSVVTFTANVETVVSPDKHFTTYF